MSEDLFDARSEELTIKLFVALIEFVEHGASRTNEGVDAMVDGLPLLLSNMLEKLRDPAKRERAKQHAATLVLLDSEEKLL